MIVTRSANLKFLHQAAQHGPTNEHQSHAVPDHGEVTVSINVLLKNVVIVPWGITVELGGPAASHSGYKIFEQRGHRDGQTTRIVMWHTGMPRSQKLTNMYSGPPVYWGPRKIR